MSLKIQKTYTARPSDLEAPRWWVFDASKMPLGRLASEIARILQGKHRPSYTPHMLTGDFVVVINARQVKVTGKKLRQKVYYFHSGYPGGLREFTLEQMLQRNPVKVIKHAVWGMLPKNALGRRMLSRLKVYPGPEHPHTAQVQGFPPPQGPHTGRKEVKG